MTTKQQELLNDSLCHIVSTFDLQDKKFHLIAQAGHWFTEQVTSKAALISFPGAMPGALQTEWIPKTAIGFDPGGSLYLKNWKWAELKID